MVSAGGAVWEWAGTEEPDRRRDELPDVVLAAAGDVPTMEVLAAAQLLRRYVPHLRVRVVNVVDLMGLLPVGGHPAAFTTERFTDLFTDDRDVVFAFHGHPRAIHPLLHGPTSTGSTSAGPPSTAPPRRRSTWWCSTSSSGTALRGGGAGGHA